MKGPCQPQDSGPVCLPHPALPLVVRLLPQGLVLIPGSLWLRSPFLSAKLPATKVSIQQGWLHASGKRRICVYLAICVTRWCQFM